MHIPQEVARETQKLTANGRARRRERQRLDRAAIVNSGKCYRCKVLAVRPGRRSCEACGRRDSRLTLAQLKTPKGIERTLQRKYGISSVQYSGILLQQGGCCGICGRAGPLEVDHDHATGMVRGLLCDRCNRGIGMLGDTRAGIASAMDYLFKECL